MTGAHMHGTIHSEFVRLLHPVTGRFVAEYDPLRGLLLVVDRGKQAIIDLVRVERDTGRQIATNGHDNVGNVPTDT